LNPPLSFTAPFERYLLLVNIWRYMKENPLPLEQDEEKMEERLKDVDAKYVDVMKSILNANIARASHLFGYLFPVNQSKKKTVV
jgi:hypothetical protein